MVKETRPKDYPKLKRYKPSKFMLETSHYDKAKADRAVTFIENLCHTKGKWAGTRFWLLPWQEQLIRDIFGIVKPVAGDCKVCFRGIRYVTHDILWGTYLFFLQKI